jgi:hypothetical protein
VSERDDASAGNQADGDDPYIADRIAVGSEKRNGDHKMGKTRANRYRKQERDSGSSSSQVLRDTFGPRKEMGGFGNWRQPTCMKEDTSQPSSVWRGNAVMPLRVKPTIKTASQKQMRRRYSGCDMKFDQSSRL